MPEPNDRAIPDPDEGDEATPASPPQPGSPVPSKPFPPSVPTSAIGSSQRNLGDLSYRLERELARSRRRRGGI